MKENRKKALEGAVTALIVLVLIQTVVEDLFILLDFPYIYRRILIFTGFAFDLLFTLEFLIRTWNALLRRALGGYLFHQNGWVDLAASVPLLIFTSGPQLIALLSGAAFAGPAAMVGLLKIVKVVRMARVLRLLRILKIFRRIRFTESVMVQRHTVRIVTTAAATLIFAAAAAGALFAFIPSFGLEEAWSLNRQAALRTIPADSDSESTRKWGRSHSSVFLLKNEGRTLYARENNSYLVSRFGPGDYTVSSSGPYTVWFDLRPAAVSQSRLNLTIFLSTLAVVILIMVTYSPHFAITVSDPVNVMARGMKEKSYNFEVSVPSQYASDGVFLLAAAYNDEYLPLKERTAGSLDISIEDISDLLNS